VGEYYREKIDNNRINYTESFVSGIINADYIDKCIKDCKYEVHISCVVKLLKFPERVQVNPILFNDASPKIKFSMLCGEVLYHVKFIFTYLVKNNHITKDHSIENYWNKEDNLYDGDIWDKIEKSYKELYETFFLSNLDDTTTREMIIHSFKSRGINASWELKNKNMMYGKNNFYYPSNIPKMKKYCLVLNIDDRMRKMRKRKFTASKDES